MRLKLLRELSHQEIMQNSIILKPQKTGLERILLNWKRKKMNKIQSKFRKKQLLTLIKMIYPIKHLNC